MNRWFFCQFSKDGVFALIPSKLMISVYGSFSTLAGLLVLLGLSQIDARAGQSSSGIEPSSIYPYYWQYHGEPVLLLGGSKDDNLFQLPDLETHLAQISESGGNYVRNTMSDRPNGGFEVSPFRRLEDGRYDLAGWSDEYWNRFENLLEIATSRGIVVQLEVWDRFDYSRDEWKTNAYNPKNNINYTYESSSFVASYPMHPGRNEHPFFFTTPGQEHNRLVLKYQKRFVEKLTSIAFRYDNVLYCIDNETSGQESWSTYWATYIAEKAKIEGVEVHMTEMWDDHDLEGHEHRRTFDHPQRYHFVDISQNNHQSGETHWNNIQWAREYISSDPRPMNMVKVYGADGNKYKHTNRDAIERFWRALLGGVAAVRFHRPPAGLGFSDEAENCIRSARLLENVVRFWNLEPRQDLLEQRSENEAYLAVDSGAKYVVYFTDGGSVTLDLSDDPGKFKLRWLDVLKGQWYERLESLHGAALSIAAPSSGHWVALLTRDQASN